MQLNISPNEFASINMQLRSIETFCIDIEESAIADTLYEIRRTLIQAATDIPSVIHDGNADIPLLLHDVDASHAVDTDTINRDIPLEFC